MRRFLPLLLVFLAARPATAQEAEVVATVQRFFDAMAARDTTALRAVLVPEGLTFSLWEREGRVEVGRSRNVAFLARLASATERWHERMWNPEVRVRGGLAMVWTAYDFHRDDRFSHCGVDAFTLIRYADGWKIAGVAYTVEREGCTGPPDKP